MEHGLLRTNCKNRFFAAVVQKRLPPGKHQIHIAYPLSLRWRCPLRRHPLFSHQIVLPRYLRTLDRKLSISLPPKNGHRSFDDLRQEQYDYQPLCCSHGVATIWFFVFRVSFPPRESGRSPTRRPRAARPSSQSSWTKIITVYLIIINISIKIRRNRTKKIENDDRNTDKKLPNITLRDCCIFAQFG